MTTITLDTGTASIAIAAPSYPEQPGETYPMIVNRSNGGRVLTADMGDGTTWETPTLPYTRLSDADHTTLANFLKNDTNWAETPVTYTDPFGTNHTNMHIVSTLAEFRRVAYDKWAGTLRLVKDMAA